MLALSGIMASSKLKVVFGMELPKYSGCRILIGIMNRACYVAIPLYICGFVTLGAALQKHLGVGALVMGWGIAELSIIINTVAVYAYCNDAFPKHQVCKTLQCSSKLLQFLFELYFL